MDKQKDIMSGAIAFHILRLQQDITFLASKVDKAEVGIAPIVDELSVEQMESMFQQIDDANKVVSELTKLFLEVESKAQVEQREVESKAQAEQRELRPTNMYTVWHDREGGNR